MMTHAQSLDRPFENRQFEDEQLDLLEALNLYQEFLESFEWEEKNYSDGEYEEWVEQTYTLGNPETVDDLPF